MKTIELIVKSEYCCGCSACFNICPKNAISMSKDEKGFLYPNIDESKCIDCMKCLMVCDFKKFKPSTNKTDSYGVKNKSAEEIASSRSGAFFINLSDYVIKRNGTVFGSILDEKCKVYHCSATTKEQVDLFKGSKYVQSVLKNTFSECKGNLLAGKYVLFSGTACQIHGLISYLNMTGVSTENLITCDLVCHGVPSPQIWEEFVSFYEKKYKSQIIDFRFRDKRKIGWRAHREYCKLGNGIEFLDKKWTDVFYSNNMLRESCFVCKYTTPNRISDFTIADYWGVENNIPEFDDDKGTSLVLIHTDKGKKIFAELNESINFKAVDIKKSLQPNLIRPTSIGKHYFKFWQNYFSMSKTGFMKKYFFQNKITLFIKAVSAKIRWILKK